MLFDGIAVAGGAAAVKAMSVELAGMEHLRDAYRHGKALLFLGEASALWEGAGIASDADDPGLLLEERSTDEAIGRFVQALAAHRVWSRGP